MVYFAAQQTLLEERSKEGYGSGAALPMMMIIMNARSVDLRLFSWR
jgi:hypothetical protein